MKWMELSVTLFYFAGCLGIALGTRRAASDASSFWAADRNVGAWVNGFGTFSTLVSAASFLGFLGMTCRWGWTFTAVGVGTAATLGFILSMLLVSGPLRTWTEERGTFTLSGYLGDRYGPTVGTLSSLLIVVTFSAYIVPQLIGGGLAAQYVLGVSPRIAIVVVGAVFVFYVLVGGMLSVTWTDFMQGILMFALMVGLAVIAMAYAGGPGALVSGATAARPQFLGVHPDVSPWSFMGFTLGVLLFVLSAPHTVMRLFTARNVDAGRKALLLCAALCLVFHTVGYLGVAGGALILDPAHSNLDATYVVVMNRLLPAWGRGLAVAAILAAIMSTTAGLLLTAGAEFSTNLYKRFVRPAASDLEVIRVARASMLAIGVGTVLIALVETRGIGDIVGQLVAAMGSAFAAPLVLGIWWRRASGVGGLFGLVGGLGAYLAAHYSGGLPPFCEVLISFPVSVAGVVLGSLLSPAPALALREPTTHAS